MVLFTLIKPPPGGLSTEMIYLDSDASWFNAFGKSCHIYWWHPVLSETWGFIGLWYVSRGNVLQGIVLKHQQTSGRPPSMHFWKSAHKSTVSGNSATIFQRTKR